MALIASQEIIEEGLVVTMTSLEATSNTFTNSGKEFIYIRNDALSSITLTVVVEVAEVEDSIYGLLTKSNSVSTVAAARSVMVGPFPVSSYNADESLVTFTVSSYSDIDVAILYLENK